ncbi:MAG: molybdopterin cofactor-binding domain-containing protein [Chloroflexota bacterium]
MQPRGLAYMALVRSPYGHARIKSVDVSAAARLPGVIAVMTGEEFRALAGPMPFGAGEGGGGPKGMAPVAIYPLAIDRVRHVGQALAVVVAESRAIAEDALERIAVDYEPLPAVTDAREAVQPGAPRLYDNVPNNVAFTWTRQAGDSDRAFAEADIVVHQILKNQRLASISLEPRSVLAEPDSANRGVSVYTSTQNPHSVRSQIAQALFEEECYDEEGQLITGSLMDYPVPIAENLPSFETARTETLTPVNPLGAKGVGELATMGSAPAVVNAVMDALSPLGIRHVDMPLRPERIWRAIQAARETLISSDGVNAAPTTAARPALRVGSRA